MTNLETVPWSELGPEFYSQWGRPNGKVEAEHVSVVGPTGSGKSVFQTEILKERARLRGSAAVIIATKPADKTLKDMGWPIQKKWQPKWGQDQVIFWPNSPKVEEGPRVQHVAIRAMLNDIWVKDANRIILFDEIAYIEQELRLKQIIDRYWREARSMGISIVAGTQRPRNVSRYMWSESTWIVAFPPADEDEAKRVAEVIGGRTQFFKPLMELPNHHFIIRHRREKVAYISKLEM